MQARCLPARSGALWVLAGFRLFRANPPLLSALTFGYVLLAIGVNLLPYIGPVLLPLLQPVLTLIVANGCRAIERGGMRPDGKLFAGLREHQAQLARLGGLQLIGWLAVLSAAYFLDVDATALAADEPDQAAVAWLLVRLMALAVPVLVAFWFAPLLTGWDGVPPAKSLFFSLVAVARNWRAFGTYMLSTAMLAVVLPAMLVAVFAMLSPALGQTLALVLRTLLLFVLVPVLMAGAYLSYREIFVHE